MIRKIIIFFAWILLFSNASNAKNPPLGTGSLVPANIMIMLDNSGSMAWDLRGRQPGSNDEPLKLPSAIDVDSKGNVYVLDYHSKRIKVFTASGQFTKSIINRNTNRPNPNSTLGFNVNHFAIYNDEIYVVQCHQNGWSGTGTSSSLRVFDLNGSLKRSATIQHVKIGSTKYCHTGIAVNANYIFLGTYSNAASTDLRKIQVYNRGNLSYSKVIQNNSWRGIQGLKLNDDGDKLLVALNYNHQVCLHTVTGSNIGSTCTKIGKDNGGPSNRGNGYLFNPNYADFDSNGNIFVSDNGNHRIQKFNSSGTYLGKLGGTRSKSNEPFSNPQGIVLDTSDKILVVDVGNDRVRAIDDNANTLTLDFSMGTADTRMNIARRVIKRIVSNSELTAAANFGLMEWGHPYRRITRNPPYTYNTWRYNWYGTKIIEPVSKDGAANIYSKIEDVHPGGGTYLRQALRLSNTYYKGASSPVIKGATCQANYLIVISDGVWSDPNGVNRLARSMRLDADLKMKTFAIGFAAGGLSGTAKRNYKNLAANGGTTDAIFADNEDQMIIKLTDAIKQIVAGSLSFTAPAVMSDKQKGDFIYQSTFEYGKNIQWQGHIKKHKWDKRTGALGAVEWDAATLLNSRSASDRSIFTVGLTAKNLNNFTTSNRSELSKKLFQTGVYPTTSTTPTNTEVDNFINFIRGVDVFDEDVDSDKTETRHKLADIYHANINIVGPVEADATADDGTTNYLKKDNHYRANNNYGTFRDGNTCGEVCSKRTEVVLAGSNGGILHAFDASNGKELWGFIPPNVIGKLQGIITSKANATNPIHAIDGQAVVKDIYYDNKWRTVLFSGLGAGGHGYFALDVTNIKSPKHLFAFQNDPFKSTIKFWSEDETETTYDYSGGANVADAYDYRKLGESWSAPRIIRIKHNNNDKWVAVVGGGYNSGVNPNYGSAVFVIDLEDGGKVLKRIDITDSASSNIVNSVPADLAVITADGTEKANYNGGLVYVADLEGKITKINLTDQGTMYQQTTLFNSESNTSNGRMLFHKPEATIKDSKLWMYFGSGNIQKLQDQSSNIKNRLYGIKDKDFPNFVAINSAGTIANCKTGNNCPTNSDLGWYIDLDKSKKVTAEPTVDKDLVYFPVYEPKSLSNACETGDAILYSANTTCGKATQTKLGKGALTKVVIQDGNLVVGISGEVEKGLQSKDNLISLKSTQKAQQKLTIEGWKENF